MDLSGSWLAAPADEVLRREYMGVDFDDRAWEPLTVPGHWRSAAAFATSDGPVLYRRRFETEPASAAGTTSADGDVRSWLVLDGVFYQSDVWLDGVYLGDTEGYFFPHEFEVSSITAPGREHVLAVEVNCTPPADRTAKRAVTGIFQHWDCIDPGWNAGGIWRPVRIEQTGFVRISRLRVLCRDADETRAVLALRAELDADQARTVEVTTVVAGSEHRLEQSLAHGGNRLEWTVTVDQPALWWPHALGDQPLHDVGVSVWVDGRRSHTRTLRTGLRRVTLRNWVLSVNGERLFLKGANHGPTRMALGEATPEELARDIALAKDAGLDLLRVHGHITRPELYRAADEAGLLLWQDFPLQWGYSRAVRRQAVRQARRAVDAFGHHPSIALWCGHNEPFALDIAPGGGIGASLALRYVAHHELPTWNRSVLDRSVKRAFEKADPTRPTIAHSGVLPHLPKLDGTDSHTYFGWYHGDERDFPRFCATVPRMARFVSEFGAQSVPVDARFMEPERWPDLDWDRLERSHNLQRAVFERRVPPSDHATFESWRRATQAYQAAVVKHHIETLRRLKYQPTGGFAVFTLADCHPAVTWSMLGHDRAAKAAYQTLHDVCRPVIVVADRPPARLVPGDPLALDVHVVSDLRHPLEEVVVTARLVWVGGHHTWRWAGDVPPDSCVRVATVTALVPDAPGALDLDLDLVCGDIACTNRYRSRIERR